VGLLKFSHPHGADGSSHGQHQCELRDNLYDDLHDQFESSIANDAGGLCMAISRPGIIHQYGGHVSRARSMNTKSQRLLSLSRGFTLAEMMVTMAIFSFVVVGILGIISSASGCSKWST